MKFSEFPHRFSRKAENPSGYSENYRHRNQSFLCKVAADIVPEVEFTLNCEEPANKAQAVINMASIGKEV